MAKATVSATYTAEIEIGDVPVFVVKEALEANEGNGDFNVFELPGAVTLSGIEIDFS